MQENNKITEKNVNIDSLPFPNINVEENMNVNSLLFSNINVKENMSSQLINSNIISNESFKKNIMEKGKIIFKENDFFNDLDYTMSDNSFRIFYDKYFKDFNDIKVIILYMKLYETIQKEYFEINNKEI